MTGEAVEGLSMLMIAAILSAVASFLSIPFLIIREGLCPTCPTPIREVPRTPADIPLDLLVGVALLMIAVLLVFVAWVLRALGWWSMRESGWRTKEFYTMVWLAATFGPVVALLLGGFALLLGSLGPFGLIMAIVGIIEGAALLDVGLRTEVKPLSVGSALYLVAAFAFLFGSIVAVVVAGLVPNILLAIGLNKARGAVVAREAQQVAGLTNKGREGEGSGAS